jgi:hypothetical protein
MAGSRQWPNRRLSSRSTRLTHMNRGCLLVVTVTLTCGGCSLAPAGMDGAVAMAEALIRHELSTAGSHLRGSPTPCPCFVSVRGTDLPPERIKALSDASGVPFLAVVPGPPARASGSTLACHEADRPGTSRYLTPTLAAPFAEAARGL